MSFSEGSGVLSRKAQAALSLELKKRILTKRCLQIVGIPESSYRYHVKALKENVDPDAEIKELVQAKFKEHNGDYGYRRITNRLRQEGHTIICN